MLGPACGTQENLGPLPWECGVLATGPPGKSFVSSLPSSFNFLMFLLPSLLSLFPFLLFSPLFPIFFLLRHPLPTLSFFSFTKGWLIAQHGWVDWPGPWAHTGGLSISFPMELESEPLEAQGTSCLYPLFCPSLQEPRAGGNSWKMWPLRRGECGSVAENWTGMPCGEKLSTGSSHGFDEGGRAAIGEAGERLATVAALVRDGTLPDASLETTCR